MIYLTVGLPESLFQSLEQRATREGRSPDEVVLQSLTQTLLGEALKSEAPNSDDPLLRLLGTLRADTSDVSERHDYYLALAHEQTDDKAEL